MLPALGGAGLGLAVLVRLAKGKSSGTSTGSSPSATTAPHAERHQAPNYSQVTQTALQQQAASDTSLGTIGAGPTAWIVSRLPFLGGELGRLIKQKDAANQAAAASAARTAASVAATARLAAAQTEAGMTNTAAQKATAKAVKKSIPKHSVSGATVDNAATHPGVVARPDINTGQLSLLE